MSDERESRQGRQAVLSAVREAEQPLSVAEIADQVGLHVNTVRGHLELLVHLGVVTPRDRAPGRARSTARAVRDGHRGSSSAGRLRDPRGGSGQELSILGGTDQTTADQAGLLWAQALVAEESCNPPRQLRMRWSQVTALFSELGFEATTEPLADRIYLRACPYAAIRDAFPVSARFTWASMRGPLCRHVLDSPSETSTSMPALAFALPTWGSHTATATHREMKEA